MSKIWRAIQTVFLDASPVRWQASFKFAGCPWLQTFRGSGNRFDTLTMRTGGFVHTLCSVLGPYRSGRSALRPRPVVLCRRGRCFWALRGRPVSGRKRVVDCLKIFHPIEQKRIVLPIEYLQGHSNCSALICTARCIVQGHQAKSKDDSH